MKTANRPLVLLLVITLALIPALAQQPSTAPERPATLAELQSRIAALLDQPKFASARWGARIITTEGGVVFERDVDKVFTPASNMKLYTSAAALDAFGPDFKIKTSVYATRSVGKNGVLKGDLILYGRGDPNISPRFDTDDPERYNELKPADTVTGIELLADQIRAAGIKTVTGNLIGDDSFFAGDLLGPGWEWEDAQFYYGAEVSALTVNDNSVRFTVTPAARAGNPPSIKIQPQTGYLKIVNNAVTVADGQPRIGVHRPLDSNTVEFFGSLPRSVVEFKVNIAVHDPARFAAELLKEALARRGVRVRGRVERYDAVARVANPFDESNLLEIAGVESQPLAEMLKVINKQSQNLHTELMLRRLGMRHADALSLDDYGRPKSTALLGAEIRSRFLQRAGIDVAPLSLRDGSGLARQNLVTPRSTAALLEFMLGRPYAKTWLESLTVAGVDGTLKRRMRDSAAANNLRGKTGTLTYVNALSGYITTKRGQPLILSLMGNNHTGPGRETTGVMDQICAMLAEFAGEIPADKSVGRNE
ncbi:MAG TPA: D-alanyl-D-alanine carboxypeptidase/D-alanyl-D-alanine-endopeptidase [Blastocatellia bacterium]|nr:D-alanyl-D-alanine carboxypeptidase/D-alanyl-D-alanine-endopeptidase [Blastocatellia bacterium]